MAVEQVARCHGGPGGQPDLPATICCSHPRFVDADHAATEGDLGGRAAVTDSTASGVVAALRAGYVGHFGLQQLAEHVQADADRR